MLINKVLFLLFFSSVFLFSQAPYKVIHKVDYTVYKKVYKLLANSNKYEKDINEIFDKKALYTNVVFAILPTSKSIVTKMFNDLEYSAENAIKYGKSPYIIKKNRDFYDAEIKGYLNGNIYLMHINNRINRYVYYIEGTFDAFVTLNGKMIVDIQYKEVGKNIFFNVKTFIILTNPVLWKLVESVEDNSFTRKKVNELIRKNVNYLIWLGRVTVFGINRDSTINKSKY